MKKALSIFCIALSLVSLAATQTSKEYVDRRDNEILSHANEYTDDSVRGLAHDEDIPTKVSQLQNDTGYVTGSATNGLVERANSYSDEKSRQTLLAAKQYTDNATNGQSKVMSVNGRTGNVVLSSVDVHARPDNWMPSAEDVGAQPTLVSGTNIKTVNGNSLLGSGNIEIENGVNTNAVRDIVLEQLATNGIRSVGGAARPLPKYLHALDFADSYPEAAAEYYRGRGDGKADGGCSAVRNGGFLYRNFDYPFDDRAEFVVRMSAGPAIEQSNNPNNRTIRHRFASVGVAQVGTNLTEAIVTSGKPSRCYKWLPGATVDGINEHGVACNINVVGRDPHEYWDNPDGDIHPLAAVRWALDNGTTAEMVATNLKARIAFPAGWSQNFHWMIADMTETWIVENGTARKCDGSSLARRPILTNFAYFPDFYYDDSQGTERYVLLRGGANITNAWYTNAYRRETNPPWVTDLAEVIGETNRIFDAWAAHDKEYFRGQLNGGKPWWQSVHTSIYDITNRTLRVAVQETDDWYTFTVPAASSPRGVDEQAVREIVTPMIGASTNGLRRVEDMAAYEVVRTENTDWTWTSENKELEAALNAAGTKLWYQESRYLWQLESCPAEWGDWDPSGGDADDLLVVFYFYRDREEPVIYATARRPRYMDDSIVPSTNAALAAVVTNGTGAVATGDLMKLGANGRLVKATASDIPELPYLSTENGGIVNGLVVFYSEIQPATVRAMAGDVTAIVDGNIHNLSEKADRATTLSGYGITDGATKTELSAKQDALPYPTNAIPWDVIANPPDIPVISATDPTFSNAVLAVNVDFATNTTGAAYVAVTNALAGFGFDADALGDIPGGKVYGSIGALLAALAAAVAWLKKKIFDNDGKPTDTFATDLLGKQVAKDAIEDEKTRTVFGAFARMDAFTATSTESDSFDIAITKLSQLLGENVAA